MWENEEDDKGLFFFVAAGRLDMVVVENLKRGCPPGS